MRQLPNDIVQTLIRTLPLIIGGIPKEALCGNPRLCNAVRLAANAAKRLCRIENEQSGK